MITFQNVATFFDSLDGEERRYGRWVLSQVTLDELADQSPVPLPKNTEMTLMGRPIRIQENVKGLAYELDLR